jgi:D-aspartate ligase
MRTLAESVIVIYSHIVGLAVIRALGRLGIPIIVLHYLPVEMGYVSKHVLHSHRISAPQTDEDAFLSDILALADRYSGALLVPTDDYTVVALSRNKDRLEKRFRVAVQEWGIVRQIVKKQHTYQLAEDMGVPYPKTALCDSLAEAERNIPDFPFPFLLKPCEGHQFFDIFRKKVLVIDSLAELRIHYQELRNLRMPVMLQEIIPGEAHEGVNYNSYFADGEPIAEFTSEKVRIDPPFFGSPRVIVSKKIPQIIEPGRKLLRALGYQGFSCMEFKRDPRDGVYKLMEINARHNLSGSLAVACGVNFPWIMYYDLIKGEKVRKSDFEEGIYWIDLTKDIMRYFVSRKAERYSLAQYLAPYLGKHLYAILDYRDPCPFVKRCYDIVKKGMFGLGHARYS